MYAFRSRGYIIARENKAEVHGPGQRWNCSVSTDVLGYPVEVISGMSFPDHLQSVIFGPLQMHDTVCIPREDQLSRFASCYTRDADKQTIRCASVSRPHGVLFTGAALRARCYGSTPPRN